jgi:hypothetical protein
MKNWRDLLWLLPFGFFSFDLEEAGRRWQSEMLSDMGIGTFAILVCVLVWQIVLIAENKERPKRRS